MGGDRVVAFVVGSQIAAAGMRGRTKPGNAATASGGRARLEGATGQERTRWKTKDKCSPLDVASH